MRSSVSVGVLPRVTPQHLKTGGASHDAHGDDGRGPKRFDLPRELTDKRSVVNVSIAASIAARQASSSSGGASQLRSSHWQLPMPSAHRNEHKLTRRPRLQDKAPDGWSIPLRVNTACDEFDLDFYSRCARLESAYYAIDGPEHGHNQSRAEAFAAALDDVARTRFVPPTRAGGRDIMQSPARNESTYAVSSPVRDSRRGGNDREPAAAAAAAADSGGRTRKETRRGGRSYARESLRDEGDETSASDDDSPAQGAAAAAREFGRSVARFWQARCDWADSGAMLDTDAILRSRFRADFDRSLGLGVARDITSRAADDVATGGGGVAANGRRVFDENVGRAKRDGQGKEVDEVAMVLFHSHELICCLFSFYSCSGAYVSALTREQWMKLIDDLQLAIGRSRSCKRADLERLFDELETIAREQPIHAASSPTSATASDVRARIRAAATAISPRKGSFTVAAGTKSKPTESTLGRAEFLVALVKVAIRRHVLSGDIGNVGDAVRRLIEVEIPSRLSARTCAPPDVWRRKHCYREGATGALVEHESTLRLIFGAIADEHGVWRGRGAEHRLLLSIGGWRSFLHAVKLIDIDLSERDASLCWAWSRTTVVDVSSSSGRAQETHLPFLGFCEALVRVAALKALPTTAEIAHDGFETAYEYLEYMERSKRPLYHAYLARHASPWGTEVWRQPIAQSLRGLISIIVGRMESDADGEIADEAALLAWSKKFMGIGRPVDG